MVMSIYTYFQKNKHYKNTNLCKEVVLATRVSKRTIDRILVEYDQNKEFKLPKYERRPLKEHQADIQMQYVPLFSLQTKVIKSDSVVSCWKKCLGIARQYWENLGASDSDLD
ncbi:1471_t:CDS:2 [Gigaspora rosea]|nr:1471_t:CDS:2 [Gigaspora rosea]